MTAVDGSYEAFLHQKLRRVPPTGMQPSQMTLPASLFPFQRDIAQWALRRGRCAVFADTGLGKSRISLSWAANVVKHEKRPVLVLAPLAVGAQMAREGAAVGIEVAVCREAKDASGGVNVTNYERLHKFDASVFGGVVCDESSCIKNSDSKTLAKLIEAFSQTPWKLCATATPAPNDYTELGTHAEFLGICSKTEMLAEWFVHDMQSTQDWRLKKHARKAFWKWLASWAALVRKPSDLGYDDGGYQLPPLRMHHHKIAADHTTAGEMGMLFVDEARTLGEQRAARKASIGARVSECAALVNSWKGEPAIVWCELNAESDALAKLIDGVVEVRGSMTLEEKEAAIMGFLERRHRVLLTKASIAGMGLNLQFACKMAFVGVTNSHEQQYLAIRREWRFGQVNPVDVHVFASELEGAVVANLARKEEDAKVMAEALSAETREAVRAEVGGATRETNEYRPEQVMLTPAFISSGAPAVVVDQCVTDRYGLYHGDCVDVLRGLAADSVHYSLYSPPFASLYTYSSSMRDAGNVRNDGEFFEHFGHIIEELTRIMMPGRLLSMHCMDLPSSKERDGFIGVKDFKGDLIRAFQKHGWIYHSCVTIWKDPVTAMQRTKALGLLYKQLKKDSAMSRQGIPDYVVTLRKPGTNVEPVTKTEEGFPVGLWQRYASPVWMDIDPSDTLQHRSARETDDERHICPLQLEVIRRCIRLWTNPGDIVLSPFGGIGSEGWVALQEGRRAVLSELKTSYFKQAAINLADACKMPEDLFAGVNP